MIFLSLSPPQCRQHWRHAWRPCRCRRGLACTRATPWPPCWSNTHATTPTTSPAPIFPSHLSRSSPSSHARSAVDELAPAVELPSPGAAPFRSRTAARSAASSASSPLAESGREDRTRRPRPRLSPTWPPPAAPVLARFRPRWSTQAAPSHLTCHG